MNISQLVDSVARGTGLTKKQAKDAFDKTVETITTSLNKGEGVAMIGFGTFKVVERKARMGRNPQNGQEIEIPARKAIVFKASKTILGTHAKNMACGKKKPKPPVKKK